MSIIIRLQNLPWSANALDIRQFFTGLQIPEGGVHIVGGELGDAFIAFSTDEDARQAFLRSDGKIKGIQIKLMLSSRTEMQRVIEQARTQSMAAFMLPTTPAAPSIQMPAPVPAAVPQVIVPAAVPEIRKGIDDVTDKKRDRRRSRSKSRDRRDRSRDRRDRRRDRGRSRSKSRDRRDRRRGRSKSRARDIRPRRDNKGRSPDRRDNDRDDKKLQDVWVNRPQSAQPALSIIPPVPVLRNEIPSLLTSWGLEQAANSNVVATLAANLQARNMNGFQPPSLLDQKPLPRMNNRSLDSWPAANPPSVRESFGLRNRPVIPINNMNLGARDLLEEFELPRGGGFGPREDNNGDFRRGGFNPRQQQQQQEDLRAELSSRKSRFEPTIKENAGSKRSRFDNNDAGPQNACVSLEPFEGSYGDLRRFFSGLAINYRGIKVINDEFGHKTGVCYVQFRDERFKLKALDMDGLEFNGEKVVIRHISDQEYHEAVDRYNPKMDDLDAQKGAPARGNRHSKPFVEPEPEMKDFSALKVEELPTFVKEQDILHIFSQHPLISLHLDVKPKGGTVAYVKFSNKEVAELALKERTVHVIQGKPVVVKPCSDEEFDRVNQQQTEVFKKQEPAEIVSDCLMMTNLPVKSNDRDISDFFSDIGLVPTKIHLISSSVGFTGQAFCEFENSEDSAKAATKNGTIMGTNTVAVKLLPREEMERFLGSSLPHPGLGPGETLAPGTPLPPIKSDTKEDISPAPVQPAQAAEEPVVEEVDITEEGDEPEQDDQEIQFLDEFRGHGPIQRRPLPPLRDRPEFNSRSRFEEGSRPPSRFSRFDDSDTVSRFDISERMSRFDNAERLGRFDNAERLSRFDNADRLKFEAPRGMIGGPMGRFDGIFPPRRGGHFGDPRGGMRGQFERGFDDGFDLRGGHRGGRGGRMPPRGGGRFPPARDETPLDDEPGCTVYMDNVPYKAGTNEILDFFDGYNCTNHVSRRYNNDNTPSAEAKVTFYTPEDAARAVRELNGEPIWNRPISLTQE